MILLLDNYDSFTYNLLDYIRQNDTPCRVFRNDKVTLDELKGMEFSAIVLSPGPKKPADAGIMLELIDYYHNRLPILGICLGHQALGEYFGATLVKAAYPLHGKTSLISHGGHRIFDKIPREFEVMHYHSLILENVENNEIKSIAWAANGENMGLTHKKLPLTGLQFHPESILTRYGMKIISNWISKISEAGVRKSIFLK